jgi:sorbose reductase
MEVLIFVANSRIPWLEGIVLDWSTSHDQNVMETTLGGTYFCAAAAGRYWRR